MTATLVHATAVCIDGFGILLIGPSAAGKSDLALRLIDRGALLISDDAVSVKPGVEGPELCAVPNIEGQMEVRGIGIVKVAHVTHAPLRLAVELVPPMDRLPAHAESIDVAGFSVPSAKIAPFEASAPLKVEYALRMVIDAGTQPMASTPELTQESRND